MSESKKLIDFEFMESICEWWSINYMWCTHAENSGGMGGCNSQNCPLWKNLEDAK